MSESNNINRKEEEEPKILETGSSKESGEGEKKKMDPERKVKILKMLERLHLQTGDGLPPDVMKALKAGTALEEPEKVHEFWKTQPVPQEELTLDIESGPIHENLSIEQIRKTPYPLPKDFEFISLDLDDENELDKIYELLKFNYNEDAEGMFRFDYSKDFLKWALKPPGFRKDWHFGVQVTSTKKIVAFISAIPVHVRVHKNSMSMVEINFLCVHKKLRSKKLAPMLIKEVTRRSHLQGVFQAVYTAGTRIPTPVTVCPYYHRTINSRKLIEVGFSALASGMSMARRVALDALPAQPPISSLRLMVKEDIPQVRALYNKFQDINTKLAPVFLSDESAEHWLLPVNDVLWTYVAENEKGVITDFISFYRLNSSVLQHTTHKTVNAAYIYYYATASQEPLHEDLKNQKSLDPIAAKAYCERLTNLVQSALVFAKQLGFDVFNGLECTQNALFLSKLKFSIGDGSLNYYLFNWRCPPINPEDVGLVMV